MKKTEAAVFGSIRGQARQAGERRDSQGLKSGPRADWRIPPEVCPAEAQYCLPSEDEKAREFARNSDNRFEQRTRKGLSGVTLVGVPGLARTAFPVSQSCFRNCSRLPSHLSVYCATVQCQQRRLWVKWIAEPSGLMGPMSV